ncbi:unnamed protein product [Brassicogethes aeneus]|uniref:Leucine-rich repeat-containing protein 34 n=1 Tax=Brassicogethes aeneus TaxID=1431903 RepID=A0A9P0FK97_BRAAE|nr:unnamed protein product [Brassicogethes aeneus]
MCTENPNYHICNPKQIIRAALSHDFISLFCEKNSDGTRHLRLKGKDLFQRMGRRLKDHDMPEIVKYLKLTPTVTSIDFCYNEIGDSGLEILAKTFFNGENDLSYINFMHCDVTGRGLGYLNESEFFNLKEIRLNGNPLGPQSAGLIFNLLQKCSDLTYLDLAESQQTFESIAAICSFVERSRVKILDVSRVLPKDPMYINNSPALANDIGYLLDRNTSLLEIHLQKCDFIGHDMELLMYGLETNKHLIMLDVGCNNIGNYGLEVLAKWLKTKPPLRALNVSNNQIGEIGARALALVLPFTIIRLLDITNNHINDIGMNHLLFSLKKPDRIRLLYIWGNPFGEKTNLILDRLFKSGVLLQEHTDVKVYHVDGVAYQAYYPSNHYKHKYYCVMDHGCPVELKIKRNKVADEFSQPRALIDLKNYDRYPPVNLNLPKRYPCYDFCDSTCLDSK